MLTAAVANHPRALPDGGLNPAAQHNLAREPPRVFPVVHAGVEPAPADRESAGLPLPQWTIVESQDGWIRTSGFSRPRRAL